MSELSTLKTKFARIKEAVAGIEEQLKEIKQAREKLLQEKAQLESNLEKKHEVLKIHQGVLSGKFPTGEGNENYTYANSVAAIKRIEHEITKIDSSIIESAQGLKALEGKNVDLESSLTELNERKAKQEQLINLLEEAERENEELIDLTFESEGVDEEANAEESTANQEDTGSVLEAAFSEPDDDDDDLLLMLDDDDENEDGDEAEEEEGDEGQGTEEQKKLSLVERLAVAVEQHAVSAIVTLAITSLAAFLTAGFYLHTEQQVLQANFDNNVANTKESVQRLTASTAKEGKDTRELVKDTRELVTEKIDSIQKIVEAQVSSTKSQVDRIAESQETLGELTKERHESIKSDLEDNRTLLMGFDARLNTAADTQIRDYERLTELKETVDSRLATLEKNQKQIISYLREMRRANRTSKSNNNLPTRTGSRLRRNNTL